MFTPCVSGLSQLAVIEDGRLRGFMMLAMAALGLLIGVVVVILIFKSWRRTLERQGRSPQETPQTPPDPWQEAGRRLDAEPEDED
jgi:hypothetical protein